MATKNQSQSFASYFLDDIAAWIGANLAPYQVFTSDQICDACAANNTPDEVFASATLGDWAEANGYEKVTP